jgi:plasmid stabilization system protein ParE
MKVRLTPRAAAEAGRADSWWRTNRPAAPELFDRELDATLRSLAASSTLGSAYAGANLDVPVRRVLLPKTRNHLYYTVEADAVVVLLVWGARRGRGPRL